MSRTRLATTSWRLYMSGATALLLGSAAVIAARPEWFVGPTGRIPFFGGVLGAVLFTAALWLHSRAVRALATVGLLGWLAVMLSRYRAGDVGWPAAQLTLAVALAATLAMLLGAALVERRGWGDADRTS